MNTTCIVKYVTLTRQRARTRYQDSYDKFTEMLEKERQILLKTMTEKEIQEIGD